MLTRCYSSTRMSHGSLRSRAHLSTDMSRARKIHHIILKKSHMRFGASYSFIHGVITCFVRRFLIVNGSKRTWGAIRQVWLHVPTTYGKYSSCTLYGIRQCGRPDPKHCCCTVQAQLDMTVFSPCDNVIACTFTRWESYSFAVNPLDFGMQGSEQGLSTRRRWTRWG